MTLDETKRWLDAELPKLAASHDVPGVSVGVLSGGEIVESATGLLSQDTGVEATTDSVFQIGSITKIWTTTLVMQLVDEGLLDLDAPVRAVLPEFRVADAAASEVVTPRQLLTHTSGFEGDIFTETNRGTDCLELFLRDLMPDVPQLFAPGTLWSYNNAGFSTLGRIIEVLRGKPYAAVLRSRLIEPLGLTHVATLPDEALLFRAAVGHIKPDPKGPLEAAKVWALPYTSAPAGAMLAMSARSLLTFAAMHVAGGVTPDGTRVLSTASVEAMRTSQLDIPNTDPPSRHGLGWRVTSLPGGEVVHHDGNTIGQSAYLRVVPSRGFALAVLTNVDGAELLFRGVAGPVLRELAGVELPPQLTPPSAPIAVDARRYVGRYEARAARYDVGTDDDGSLWYTEAPLGEFAALFTAEPERERIVTGDGRTFVTAEPTDGTYASIAFSGDDGSGRATFLHTGRAVARVS